MIEFGIGQLIKATFFPPGIFIVLIVFSLWLLKHNTLATKRVLQFTAVSLYLLSMPIISDLLITPLESYPALTPQTIKNSPANAIIILSAGRTKYANEYGGIDITGDHSFGRLRYGAKLHEQTQLPILVTGGLADENNIPLGELLARDLLDVFKIKATWQENKSKNTAENAKFSYKILKKEGIKHIFLVSDAWHLSRAVYIFEKQGFVVTPAPTRFMGLNKNSKNSEHSFKLKLSSVLPSAKALTNSYFAMHEILGSIWYRIRY